MAVPPPPLPSARNSESVSGSIGRQAATASILIPLGLVVFARVVQGVLSTAPSEFRPLGHIAAGAVLVFLGLVGTVLGGIGLFGGGGSPRVRGGLGALLNVAVLALFASGVFRGIEESRANMSRLAAMRKEIQREAAQQSRNLERHLKGEADAASTAHEGNAALDRIQSQLAVAARETRGTGGQALDAASEYIKQLQVLSRDYETQLAAIQKTEPSNPANLSDRAQLGPRRVAIRKFLDSNERLADYLRNSDRIVKEQLQAHHVSSTAQEAFLSSFRQSDDRKQVVLKIRDTDKRIGEGMLAMLLLLDQQWGDWTYESASNRVLFQDGAAVSRFDQINRELGNAAREQQQLQLKLTKMPLPKGV